MNIIEYKPQYEEEVKDLLVELQEHLASLDKRKVIILKKNYRDDYFAYIISECKKHEGVIFIAEEGGHAIGLVVAKIFQDGTEYNLTTSCPKIGFISDLVVKKDKRGKGIGKILIEKAERYFSEKKCEYTQLEVFAPNERALELYKKLGFMVNSYYLSKKTGQDNKKLRLDIRRINDLHYG